MPEMAAEQLAQVAFDLNLLSERQLKDIWAQVGSQDVSCKELQQLLLRRELLTSYQIERILRGDRADFFYGDYKVLYLVGTGTFARVYRAVHKETEEVRAVKVLRKRFAEDKECTERFCHEGKMGATLRHPNIVPIYEVYSRGKTHFLVMEFTEGRNLREFIKIRKQFDPVSATRLVTDVAAGLAYAFERGICHRDLKMSNVLVSSRGQAKLVDFGLAALDKNVSDEALAELANPRTIDYAGLERATGVRKDDQRSDIYFLGCIYYHLLTGVPALVETRVKSERLSKTRFQSVVPIQDVDAGLAPPLIQVVNKAMELNVSQRYQTPGEMLADLHAAARLLAAGNGTAPAPAVEAARAPAPAPASAAPQRALMVVEANVDLQNIFRERLKTSGYRVLVTRDPGRALARFNDDAKAAECVLFSTGSLGEAALEAFNQFGENRATQGVPAVLLLDEAHQGWRERARLADHRVVVSMPIKLRELRAVLAKLLP